MQDLRVIGAENGALVVTSDDGTRFRLPIDDNLHAKLRQSIPDPGAGRKLAPREIQAHIRSGMSAQDVANITGVPIEYIQRFEGPVLAEREFVVESALGVSVHLAADTDPLQQGTTFGTAIRERLHDLGGTNERWASWKDATGWIVKLSFTANQVEHDARWQFDPKKHSLAPLNTEAITLSQQGDAAGSLIPRLRAVSHAEAATDAARFDSGAFDLGAVDLRPASAPAPVPIARKPADENQIQGNQTADLLEALRRRRGERETASFEEGDARAAHPSTGSIRIVELPLQSRATENDQHDQSTAPQPIAKKKGRTAMPSWDEIVFGARPDDDLA